MASGVAASGECIDAFQELKLKKAFKYIVYKISSDNTEIIVEKKSSDPDYETFLGDLPESECRYAVYDVEYESSEGGKRNKLCFYNWVPDNAKVKSKMLSASSKDALRKALVGIAADIQGTDISEVDYATVVDKLKRQTR